MRFALGAHSLARPGGLPWYNQDASFCSSSCAGVFDGVSAATRSRDFAQRLAAVCGKELAAGADEPWPGLAHRALRRARDRASAIDGAATACLVRFDASRATLSAYNLGDSGFLLFEPADGGTARLRARSASRVHADGAPYQLGGGGFFSDEPTSGVASTHALSAGAICVLHTDGLTDNLYARHAWPRTITASPHSLCRPLCTGALTTWAGW